MKALMIFSAAALISVSGSAESVKISSFGYDPEDSTRFIQAALDSDYSRIILDRQAGPWYTLPLKGRSNKEFVLEPGVELVAKRGAFLKRRDYLFEIANVTNFTLRGGEGSAFRMWKEDYRKPPYEPGEWRYGLRIVNCQNVLVEGLRVEKSGGDGIGIIESKNVTIRKCVCDGNHRQGLTLFSGENVLIEDTVMSNTEGTPPQAGVDVEPDGPDEHIINCVFRNCLAIGNAGSGFEIYLPGLRASKSPPISLIFENCRAVGNRTSLTVDGGNGKESDFATGLLTFRNCSFEDSKGTGISISSTPEKAFDVAFDNCSVSNAAGASVTISAGRFLQGYPDGIDLGNLTVYGAKDGNWYKAGKQGAGPVPARIKGRVKTVRADGTAHTEVIDSAWLSKNMPIVNGGKALPPRMALPTLKDVVSINDEAPGQLVDLTPTMCVGSGQYVFLVDKARTVRFKGRQIVLYKNYPPQKTPIKVIGLEGKYKDMSWDLSRPGLVSGEFAFNAPAPGFYALKIPCSGTRFILEASEVPIAIDVSKRDCKIAPVGGASISLAFEVPAKNRFALMMSGDSYYHFSAVLRNPSGKKSFADDLVDKVAVHSEDSVAGSGLWTLELAKAEKPCYDVIGLDLFGVNGALFLTRRKTWSCIGNGNVAKFDDMALETAAIQAQIDATAAKGGGRVTIPKGIHPCGTLYMKSGVELHLEKGAVLMGGTRSEDYDDAIPESMVYTYKTAKPATLTRKAFIFAENATNIAIT